MTSLSLLAGRTVPKLRACSQSACAKLREKEQGKTESNLGKIFLLLDLQDFCFRFSVGGGGGGRKKINKKALKMTS